MDLSEQITAIIKAWTQRRPKKSYGGYSLEEFKKVVAPCLEARVQAAQYDAKWREAKTRWADADKLVRKHVQRVVNGVKADPEDGEDSELYSAMGYVPRNVRNSLRSLGRKAAAKAAAAQSAESTGKEVNPDKAA